MGEPAILTTRGRHEMAVLIAKASDWRVVGVGQDGVAFSRDHEMAGLFRQDGEALSREQEMAAIELVEKNGRHLDLAVTKWPASADKMAGLRTVIT